MLPNPTAKWFVTPSYPTDERRQQSQITPDALSVFLLALVSAIRECQTTPASSIGIRDLIDPHLDNLLLTLGLDSFDRWSVVEIQEMLDSMIRAHISYGAAQSISKAGGNCLAVGGRTHSRGR